MKTSKCLMTWGLLSWLALSLPACSGDEVPEALSGTEQTAQASQGQITLKIQTPVPESVVLTKATYQTAEEARVYQLGIYIFKKGNGEGDADSNYTFLEYRSFGDLNGNSSLVGENGTGTFVTNIPIESGWKGKTIKVLLTANEEVRTTPSVNETTLADFKQTLLKRELNEQANADVLVMNDAGTRMQFPMSATAYKYPSSGAEKVEEVEIGSDENQSITLAASLVRCLARVDVFNDTPNLTITGIRTFQACDKGLLFPTGGGVLQPDGVEKISLKPLKSYFNGAATIPYVTPVNPDDVNSRRAANTRTAFYLCEQDVAAAGTSPVIAIGYTLDIDGTTKSGGVYVYFKEASNFREVVRNTLYRIRLGDGTKVDSDASVSIEVNDWESEDIFAVLNDTSGSGGTD